MVIECPVCRCRMEVPRGEARAYTCRNGHRFLQAARPRSRSSRHRPVVLMLSALLIALAFLVALAIAGHRWPGAG